MNKSELKIARFRSGYTQREIAGALKKSETNYRYKENGDVRFSIDEIIKLSKLLDLDLDQVNTIFFDGKLHKSQSKSSNRNYNRTGADKKWGAELQKQ